MQASPPQRHPSVEPPSALGPLIVLAGILFLLLVITHRGSDSTREDAGGAGSTRVTSHAARDASAGTETPGADAPLLRPLADAEVAAEHAVSSDVTSRGSEDATKERRDVASADTAHDVVTGVTGKRSLRRHQTRRGLHGDDGVPAAETAAHPRLGPHTAFRADSDTLYETLEETSADLKHSVTGGGTISLWVQPAWDGTSQEDASLVRIGDNQFRIYKADSYLRFEITNADGQKTLLGMPIANWNPGDWHQIVTTWDGQVISLFADGKLMGQNAYTGQIALAPDAKVYLGTNGGQTAAPGLFSDVRVGTQPLSPDDVSRRFEMTRPAPQ